MIQIVKYGSLADANLMMRGAIAGGPLKSAYAGLVGATITFSSPSGSCTFTQPEGRTVGLLTPQDIRDQLHTAIPNLHVLFEGSKLYFTHATEGQVVSMAALSAENAQPARSVLGFSQTAAVTGMYLNAPDSQSLPRYLDFVPDHNFICVAYEV